MDVAPPRLAAGLIAAVLLAAMPHRPAAQAPDATSRSGPAWLLRSTDGAGDERVARADVIETPVLPGSLMKAVTLAAALEHDVVRPDTRQMCRRVVDVNGRRYTCSHPDLKRPLTLADALAHSCNDFFVRLAARLSRAQFNDVRARVGLAPVPPATDLPAALIGLDGPRVSPREMLRAFGRLLGLEGNATIRPETRRVLVEGLRGAADYGSASELSSHGIAALAKTGTSSAGGGVLGLTVAFTPADRPQRALIVVAPGASGRDATSIAADLLRGSTLRIGSSDGAGRARIESVALESYVARVVAAEAAPDTAAAAQQALAIAARTFALANRDRHGSEGFDLCDTTHCQVARRPTLAAERATAATAGRVLASGGRVASVFYSASCGGLAQIASAIWPGATDVGMPAQGRPDPECDGEPAWTSEVTVEDLERALAGSGRKGRLRALRVTSRDKSGRAVRLRTEGLVPAEISGEDFRLAIGRRVGWERIKSTAFAIERVARGYRFTGRGFGHGVGMCLLGAARRGARGATADDILRFYYPGLRVVDAHTLDGPAAGRGDVHVALPALEERERALVTDLIRRVRDAIAQRAGVAAPSTIRVTVHPNAESYGRATMRPWWTAGATRGASIDLPPVATLRRQGQLERTVRHEVAHVVLDPVLRDRPLWVREGAASFFSTSDTASTGVAGTTSAGRSACPTDAEFDRPSSSAAMRDAYRRAEACFRRELAISGDWRSIR